MLRTLAGSFNDRNLRERRAICNWTAFFSFSYATRRGKKKTAAAICSRVWLAAADEESGPGCPISNFVMS